MAQTAQVVVAGHVCLDIIPTFAESGPTSPGHLAEPGRLITVGPAVTATGGAVANTGLALHRLGVPVRLMGKVGDDLLGRAILDIFRAHGPALADGMIVATGEASSYTIVVNLPGVDRTFWHCPGANDTFTAHDVAYDRLAGARIFHFGYPPIMRQMHADGGGELAAMLTRVRELGLTTSLDMAAVDPASEAGRVDWAGLLARALPHTDLFLPSYDEIRWMLGGPGGPPTAADLGELGERLIAMGAAVVALKLGEDGLYLATTGDAGRLASIGLPDVWVGRELLSPCFGVRVAGTTGAGDCTIAGFLAGVLGGLGPADAMTSAVAVGACCVEAPDATSGVPHWQVVRERIAAGWPRQPTTIALPGFSADHQSGVLRGPADHPHP